MKSEKVRDKFITENESAVARHLSLSERTIDLANRSSPLSYVTHYAGEMRREIWAGHWPVLHVTSRQCCGDARRQGPVPLVPGLYPPDTSEESGYKLTSFREHVRTSLSPNDERTNPNLPRKPIARRLSVAMTTNVGQQWAHHGWHGYVSPYDVMSFAPVAASNGELVTA